jgi:hypothetical protein
MSDQPLPITEPPPEHVEDEPMDVPPDWDEDYDEDEGEQDILPRRARNWDDGWPGPEHWWP